ncbi:MAG: metal ABC transporter permease [Deltaproteobacteria bacterium]|nr:metal ABC transporter permease [Deltaproteobacteria bacterium]
MTEAWQLLWDPLLRPALFAAVLSSLLCGALGTFVVLRRLTFLSGGLSHAAFGGLGLCHLLGLPPQLGGLATTALAAVLLGPLGQEKARERDALIGVLWAVGMAAGVLFLHLAPGYPPDLEAYLFGNLLLVGSQDLWLLTTCCAVSLLLLSALYKEWVAATFDETFAAVQGVPIRRLSTLLLLMVGAAVVLLLPVVGLLLVLALLTLPPLIGLKVCRDLRTVLLSSIALGLVMTLGGLFISLWADLPPGPCIILLGAGMLGGASLGKTLVR